ncbi:SDR family NAD(P)-dependent oxidoreductase [bacterium]|nr:SDR family NAD(P)-dependent oxidoreductase [bacterium]
MHTLEQRTAIITGASRGIGRSLALALGQAGANVALVARSFTDLEEMADEMHHQGCEVLTIAADVTDAMAQAQIIQSTLNRFGSLDILVNNAGQCDVAEFHTMDEDRIRQILDVNLTAPLLLSRLALPHMLQQRRGHIVMMASVAGVIGTPVLDVYAASKAGLIGFTRTIRSSYRGSGVSASAICPGLVDEAGIYARVKHETGIKTPFLAGSVRPDQVAQAMLRAIQRDLAEVYVNALPLRPLLLIQTLFPRAAEWLFPLLGADIYRRALCTYELKRTPQRRSD